MPQVDEDRLLDRAYWLSYYYLKLRPRTEHEIRSYLEKKKPKHKFSDRHINQVIKNLKDENLINDQSFIEWFIDKRTRLKPKSAMLLKRELTKHGVDKDLADNFFELEPVDEDKLACSALEARWRRYVALTPRERFVKSARFLQGRGFSYGVVKNAIAEMEKKSYNKDA